jgi:hypothetical protein
MRRPYNHSRALARMAGLSLALAVPAVARAAPSTNEETVAAAKSSPLFKKQHKRAGLKKAGLAKVVVSAGVQMQFLEYVRETALDKAPELAPLFDKKLQPELLTKAPTYSEAIYEMQDRLVVDRRLTVPLAPGACNKPSLPKAIDELCFAKNPKNKGSKAVNKDLVEIRAKLSKAAAGTIAKGTVSAAEAAKLNDEQLLDLLLNTDARTIHHVSVVPRVPVTPGGKGLHDLAATLAPAAIDANLAEEPKGTIKPKHAAAEIFAGAKTFATKYFLTGFTYGREFDDAWEYTFADSTWLTDRYYIRVAYHLGLGFGVRAPFSIDVKASGGQNSRTVELAVAPVDVDATGSPAYQATGLPQNQTFGGNEFVLEFKASCSLYVSIPGPNFDKKCPSIDKGFSRDVDPVIGSEVSKIHDWWLEGSVTGLKLDFAVASASLDIGLGADVTNGSIGVRASPLPSSSFTGLDAGNLSLTSRQPISFGVTRSAGATGAGFRLDQPKYGFDIRVMPKLRGKIEVDVAIYENSWIIGPYSLDFLSVSQRFMLSRHAGTVEKHDFALFQDTGGVLDPNTANPTPPPKKPPTAKNPGGALPPTAGKLPN